MPKTKSPGGGAHHPPGHAHSVSANHKHNNVNMDKVKIKRVKRNKKKTTTKEKILAGLGVGGALMGGIGAVNAKPSQTQFVRTENPADSSSSGSKVKQMLKNVFGFKQAKAAEVKDGQVWDTNPYTGQEYLVGDVNSPAAQAVLGDAGGQTSSGDQSGTDTEDSSEQNRGTAGAGTGTVDGGTGNSDYFTDSETGDVYGTNPYTQQRYLIGHAGSPAALAVSPLSATRPRAVEQSVTPPGLHEGDTNSQGQVYHNGQWTTVVSPMSQIQGSELIATTTQNQGSGFTITLSNGVTLTATDQADYARQMMQYNTRFANDQQVARAMSDAYNRMVAQNTPTVTSGAGAAYNTAASAANFSPGFLTWMQQNHPNMNTSPSPTDVAAVTALQNASIEYQNFVQIEQQDQNYMQAYNNWLAQYSNNPSTAGTAPVKPDGFDQRHKPGSAGMTAPQSATTTLPAGLSFTTNGNRNAPQVGDTWQVVVSGKPGDIVYSTSNGVTTPMGQIGSSGQFMLNGTFSAGDLTNGQPTQWNETWTVGSNVNSATQAGTLQFTLNPYGVSSQTVNATAGNYSATVKPNSNGTFTVTLSNGVSVTATNIEDFNRQIQVYNVAGDAQQQRIFISFAQASNRINSQVVSANTAPSSATGYTPTYQQVQGTGPNGVTYNLNSAYYASQETANYLAQQFGGHVVSVDVTSDWQRFHYPSQLFIEFADGTRINAGQLATYAFTNPQALRGAVPASVYNMLTSGVNVQTASGAGSTLRLINTADGNTNTLNVGDTWTIPIQAPAGSRVYATDAKGNRTYMGTTDAQGNLTLKGTITADQVGQWVETWTIGTDSGNTGTIGTVKFLVTDLSVATKLTSGTGTTDPNANPGATSRTGAGTLTFKNSNGSSTLGVGNNWAITVTGANKNAPVYGYGGVVGGSQGWIYLGTTDSNGSLNVTGRTLNVGDVGSWDVQVMVGNTGDLVSAAPTGTKQVGTDLQFSVTNTKVAAPTAAPTSATAFQSNVQGSGPTGSYALSSQYYATPDTASWLASHYGGTAVLLQLNTGTPFSQPGQWFVKFADGTTVNAGELAQAYLNGYGGTNGTGGDASVQSYISTYQREHAANTGATTPDGVTVVSWEYNPVLHVYVGTDTQGRKVSIFEGKGWQINVGGDNANTVWVPLTSAGPAKVTVFNPKAAFISYMTPAAGKVGSTVQVTITGANLAGSTLSFASGSGLTISNQQINSEGTQITATFTIASSATIGDKVLTITNSSGASTKAFSVTSTSATNSPAVTVASLNLSSSTATVSVGSSNGTISAVVNFSDGTTSKNVSVSSSNDKVKTWVDANGTISIAPVTVGSSVVTVHPIALGTDTSKDKTINVTITGAAAAGLTIDQLGNSGGLTLDGLQTASTGLTLDQLQISTNGLTIDQLNTAPVFATASLPGATIGQQYNAAIEVSNPSGVTFSLTGGQLPFGLTLSSAGVISGMSNTAGTFNFTVSARNAQDTTSKQFSIVSMAVTGGGVQGNGTYSGGNGTIYGQSAGVTLANLNNQPFVGLQMPANSGGLQMPTGLQMPVDAGNQTAQVQGVTTAASSYVVKKGDTLWGIAKATTGDGRNWRKILSANPDCLKIPGDTHSLKIGAKLVIPQ